MQSSETIQRGGATWPYGLALFVLMWLIVFAIHFYSRRATRATEQVAGGAHPWFGAEGAIGGIESITIGGKRYWFGFSYQADAVLSPLLDEQRAMAHFASEHMRQRDGAHPPSYWEPLVAAAVEESELSAEPGSRDFSGREVREVLELVAEARRQGGPVGVAELPQHLTYLMGAAATGEDAWFDGAEGPVKRAFESLIANESCLTGALSVMSGKHPPPSGVTFTDALEVVAAQLAHWRHTTPENWRSLLLQD